MKVLVTGANGFIGSRLVERLLCEGHEVRALTRSGSENSHIPSEVKLFAYDGSSRSLEEAATGVERAYHLAAVYKTAQDVATVDTLLASNVVFSTQLLRALSEHSPEASVVAASTWSAFNEEHIYAPSSFYDATKMAVEILAAAFPLHLTFLRFPDTYGEGDWRTKVHYLLRNAVVRGDETFTFQKPARQVMNLLHVDDLVEALLVAGENQAFEEGKRMQTYDLFMDRNRITLGELAELLTAGTPLEAKFTEEASTVPFPYAKGSPLMGFLLKHDLRASLRPALFEEPK